ncbi:MAG: hypothetical protein WD176_07920, partial [Pirellulales bacterium]
MTKRRGAKKLIDVVYGGCSDCESPKDTYGDDDAPNVLETSNLGDGSPAQATACDSTPGWTRTSNLRIRSLQQTPETVEKNAVSENSAARGAAVSAENHDE